jgi:molecular chaperone DnaK
VPTRKTETFSTAADNQTSVEIHVLQGERAMARDNRTLGKFQLIGIPPAPRGIPQVEVTFDIDANGILHVTAKDMGTGKTQDITITASSGLNKDEVDRMQKDADSHADEDRKRRDDAEARNRADSMIYNTEKLLRENREKIAATDVQEIESALAEAKQAVDKGKSSAEIDQAVDRLTKATHKMAESMYQQAAGQGPGPGGTDGAGASGGGPASGGAGGPGDVIDAELVDEEDNKDK